MPVGPGNGPSFSYDGEMRLTTPRLLFSVLLGLLLTLGTTELQAKKKKKKDRTEEEETQKPFTPLDLGEALWAWGWLQIQEESRGLAKTIIA